MTRRAELLPPGHPDRADHVLVRDESCATSLDGLIADVGRTIAAGPARADWRRSEDVHTLGRRTGRPGSGSRGRRLVRASVRVGPDATKIVPLDRPEDELEIETGDVDQDDPVAVLVRANRLLRDARARKAADEAARSRRTWALAIAATGLVGAIASLLLPTSHRRGSILWADFRPPEERTLALIARTPTFLVLCVDRMEDQGDGAWTSAGLHEERIAIGAGTTHDPAADPIATMRALAETAA